MRRYTLSSLLAIFTLAIAIGQPTMTRDWVGSPGDEFAINFATTVPSQGPAGADQTWDFSSVTGDTITANSAYFNVGDTPYADEFPESNLALGIDAFGVFSYLNINGNIMEDLGNGNPFSLSKSTDARTILEFPLTFGDSFQDTYASSTSAFGVTAYTTGTVNATVDAYGTVELPQGTFENCIRIKVIEESVDSTDLGVGIVEKILSTVTSYYWYSPDSPGPLCYRDFTESLQIAIVPPLPNDTVALPSDSAFVFDPNATVSSVVSFDDNAFSLTVAPNPLSTDLNLKFTVDNPDMAEFSIRTITGQTVYSQNISTVTGENRIRIPIESIAPGTYSAILIQGTKGQVTQIIKI